MHTWLQAASSFELVELRAGHAEVFDSTYRLHPRLRRSGHNNRVLRRLLRTEHLHSAPPRPPLRLITANPLAPQRLPVGWFILAALSTPSTAHHGLGCLRSDGIQGSDPSRPRCLHGGPWAPACSKLTSAVATSPARSKRMSEICAVNTGWTNSSLLLFPRSFPRRRCLAKEVSSPNLRDQLV